MAALESPAQRLRPWLYAGVLHLACGLLLWVGVWWSQPPPAPSVRGSVIEAVLVAAPPPSARPAASARAPQPSAPRPQPIPEPRPQQAAEPPQPAPQQQVRPDTVERERAAALAREQSERRAREEAVERRRQEQVELDAERQQQEAERRERLARLERERQAQLEDIRRQREQAERERQQAEADLREITERRTASQQPARPDTTRQPAAELGNEGIDQSLLGRYQLAIQQAVERSWIRPETVRPGVPCRVRIIQIPGGEVISASVDPSCPYDELGRRSVEAAVLRAKPLPYRGFEPVFRREITFTFRAPEG